MVVTVNYRLGVLGHDRQRGGRVPGPAPGGEPGRCANPRCAELWETPDGRPWPLEQAATGRPRAHCSRRCKDAVSNAAKRSFDQCPRMPPLRAVRSGGGQGEVGRPDAVQDAGDEPFLAAGPAVRTP